MIFGWICDWHLILPKALLFYHLCLIWNICFLFPLPWLFPTRNCLFIDSEKMSYSFSSQNFTLIFFRFIQINIINSPPVTSNRPPLLCSPLPPGPPFLHSTFPESPSDHLPHTGARLYFTYLAPRSIMDVYPHRELDDCMMHIEIADE